MPRELITLQVGQCGNQVGYQFWDAVLREHLKYCKNGILDESILSLFQSIDTRHNETGGVALTCDFQQIKSLRARAILIDMEKGAINELLRSTLGNFFESTQVITDVSGSGNNWACGHEIYGPQHCDTMLESIRHLVEHCDSLQSFLLLHSLGGGTGSGIGTYLLELLTDEFPGPHRFTASVFPSSEDDVVTSPYNSCLAMWKLREYASCVFPVSNDALIKLCKKGYSKERKPFENLNTVIAQLLTNLTSSMRFNGSLNVDLNEISTNLVPYPSLHFILSSMSPIGCSTKSNCALSQHFLDILSPNFQLTSSYPKKSIMLACAFLLRGNISISEILDNVKRTKALLRTLNFNQDAFKLGQCMIPPVGQEKSLLYLYNSCEIINLLEENTTRFLRLYNRKAHLHHYSKFMDLSTMTEALECLEMLTNDYRSFQNNRTPLSYDMNAVKIVDQPSDEQLKSLNRKFSFSDRTVVDVWELGNRPFI